MRLLLASLCGLLLAACGPGTSDPAKSSEAPHSTPPDLSSEEDIFSQFVSEAFPEGYTLTEEELELARLIASERIQAMSTDPVPSSPDTLIRLTRSMCFGECPVYTVEVNGRGEVRYEGRMHVAIEGEQRATVEPDAVQDLIDAFAAVGHADFPRGLNSSNPSACSGSEGAITSTSSAITVLRLNGFEKLVDHEYGCFFEGDRSLLNLEDEIDRVLNTVRWIEGDTLGTR